MLLCPKKEDKLIFKNSKSKKNNFKVLLSTFQQKQTKKQTNKVTRITTMLMVQTVSVGFFQSTLFTMLLGQN